MENSKPVVLSVDDEANVLKSLKRTLRKIDIELLTATSGKEGLDILASRPVDVILSDMRMPEMSGPEFLKLAAEKQPDTKRIVLTGYADVDAAQSAINDGGVTRYLNKPWDDDELRRVIEEAARVSNLEKENSHLQTLNEQQNKELQTLNEQLEVLLNEKSQQLEHTSGVLDNTLQELETSYEQMIHMVANIAAMPNPESENSQRKLQLASAMGAHIEMDDEQLLHLQHATRLHRVGWVGIPRAIKDKARAAMNSSERDDFEKHPAFGAAVLLSVPRLKTASSIIEAQHEEWSGAGFPNKLVGEGIPLGSRVLAVARDYYDFLAGRILADKQTPGEAARHIREGAESAYDPAVVKAFNAVIKEVEELDVSLDEINLQTMSLLPGMRLSRDLCTDQGALLLSKGSLLSEDTIGTLLNLERRSNQKLQVYVVNADS